MIKKIALERGLEIIPVSEHSNGYPDSGKNGVIGFKTFKEVEAFAKEFNLVEGLFTKRDGHHFWYYRGNKFESLTSTDLVSDLGDDYSILKIDYLKSEIEDIICYQLESVNVITKEHISDIISYLMDKKNLLEQYANKEPDEDIITCQGAYYETVKKEMLAYHEDVTSYQIGVYFIDEED